MKLKPSLFAVACVSVILIAIAGCKTAPQAETQTAQPSEVVQAPEPTPAPVPEVAPKPVDDALTALRDKMEGLRNEGLKYGLNTYRPEDWTGAESSRDAGLSAYGSDYDAAQSAFEDAIARYEALRRAAFDSISSELEAEIAAARAEAVRVGADGYYPEQFAMADVSADTALSLKSSDDLAGAYDAAQIALLRYKSLIAGMSAVGLKDKIDKNDFAQYAEDDYAAAGQKYDEAASAYGTADAAALDSMNASVDLYTAVKNAGYKKLSEELAPKVEAVRALSDGIKAERAAKDDYAKAANLRKTAYGFADSQQWEEAYETGQEALSAYTAVYQNVLLKRNAADAAMAAARQRQESSTELARKADEIAPIPEGTEGYSEELPAIDENSSAEEEAK